MGREGFGFGLVGLRPLPRAFTCGGFRELPVTVLVCINEPFVLPPNHRREHGGTASAIHGHRRRSAWLSIPIRTAGS